MEKKGQLVAGSVNNQGQPTCRSRPTPLTKNRVESSESKIWTFAREILPPKETPCRPPARVSPLTLKQPLGVLDQCRSQQELPKPFLGPFAPALSPKPCGRAQKCSRESNKSWTPRRCCRALRVLPIGKEGATGYWMSQQPRPTHLQIPTDAPHLKQSREL